MKRIINRRTGKAIENPFEARALVKSVKRVFPLVQADNHLAPHGRSSPLLAKRADLQAIKDAHDGYICIYEGAENCGFAGYKALFIGFKELPADFEVHFPNYVVIGE